MLASYREMAFSTQHAEWSFAAHCKASFMDVKNTPAKQCQQMDEDSNIKEWERLSWTEQESKGNNSPAWSLKIHEKNMEKKSKDILKIIPGIYWNYWRQFRWIIFFPCFIWWEKFRRCWKYVLTKHLLLGTCH